MKMLMMLTGLAARLLRRTKKTSSEELDKRSIVADSAYRERRAAEALAAMRDANMADEASERKASLNGCYHNGVAYSLGYDANGSVELCGNTFTSLDTGFDGGAVAALRRHRQNFDPTSDVPRFIVALKPVKVHDWRSSRDTKAYGLDPGPLAGKPPTADVWGEHVANGRFNVVKQAVEQVKQDCERRGVDISKSTVTISVKPHDGQEAFARCEKVERAARADADDGMDIDGIKTEITFRLPEGRAINIGPHRVEDIGEAVEFLKQIHTGFIQMGVPLADIRHLKVHVAAKWSDGTPIVGFGPLLVDDVTLCRSDDNATINHKLNAGVYRAMAAKAESGGDSKGAAELNSKANGCERCAANGKCDECSCPHCECDGRCDPDYATSCHRCDTWVCGYCMVDGACHNCFSKMQGGVN